MTAIVTMTMTMTETKSCGCGGTKAREAVGGSGDKGLSKSGEGGVGGVAGVGCHSVLYRIFFSLLIFSQDKATRVCPSIGWAIRSSRSIGPSITLLGSGPDGDAVL